MAVSGLAAGRCEAKDPEPVGPVPEAIVERTIEHLTPTLEAMVRLQLASAMRPGEVVIMRACDLNMSGPIWEYRPETFKTEHHAGSSRVIMLGPKAQEVIRPFLRLNVSGYLFSPRQSEAERNAERRAERKTPLWPSHVKHQEAKKAKRPGRKAVGDRWQRQRLSQGDRAGVRRGFPSSDPRGDCSRASLTDDQKAELEAWRKSHRWHPNQLQAYRRNHDPAAIRGRSGSSCLGTCSTVHDGNLRREEPRSGSRDHEGNRLIVYNRVHGTPE